MQECSLQTEIRTLGPCKLDSVLPYRTWADNKTVQIVVDEELSEEVNAPFSVCLEAAGPRKKDRRVAAYQLHQTGALARRRGVACQDVVLPLKLEGHHGGIVERRHCCFTHWATPA